MYARSGGVDVEGAAGLWVHFVSFSARGAGLNAIVPASATFTNYGRKALNTSRPPRLGLNIPPTLLVCADEVIA
jgi:hypothetical protein